MGPSSEVSQCQANRWDVPVPSQADESRSTQILTLCSQQPQLPETILGPWTLMGLENVHSAKDSF